MEEYWKGPTDTKLYELVYNVSSSDEMKWPNEASKKILKPSVDYLVNHGARILESKHDPAKYLIWKQSEPVAWYNLMFVSVSVSIAKHFCYYISITIQLCHKAKCLSIRCARQTIAKPFVNCP